MVFVGHLDLMKTIDRAARRAALPVSGGWQFLRVVGRCIGQQAVARGSAGPGCGQACRCAWSKTLA